MDLDDKPAGYLNERQQERFINYMLEACSLRIDGVRVHCLLCGSSWDEDDYDDMSCACSRYGGNWNPNVYISEVSLVRMLEFIEARIRGEHGYIEIVPCDAPSGE